MSIGRSEVPTQSDRPSQSASVHVSLRGAVRRVSCLSEKVLRLTVKVSCLTEKVLRLTERVLPLSEKGFASH